MALAEELIQAKPESNADALIIVMHAADRLNFGNSIVEGGEIIDACERAIRTACAYLAQELGVDLVPFGSENFFARSPQPAFGREGIAMNALSPQATDTLAGSTALSPIGADAEMIAMCAAICEPERAYDAVAHEFEPGSPEEEAAERERVRTVAEKDALVARMCELPCTTLAGVQAMARALAAWDRELLKDGPAHDVGELITSHMVERLLALGTPNADADLLAVCAEFRVGEVALSHICDAEPELSDEERDALIIPIVDDWERLLGQMAALHAKKAAAAMHQLRVAFDCDIQSDWPGWGEEMAWHVLSEIAGDTYAPSASGRSEPPRRVIQSAGPIGSAGA